jgi:hypothetical protein
MCISTSVMTARREPDQPRPPARKQLPGRGAEGEAALRLETSPVNCGSSAEGIRTISEATPLTSAHVRDGARNGRAPCAANRGMAGRALISWAHGRQFRFNRHRPPMISDRGAGRGWV